MFCDVLVIGAGVIGLSSAYHLKKRNPNSRIIVIDKLDGPGQGNTAKSAGGFRNVLSSEKNFLLADSTIDWFFHLQGELGHNLKLAKIGYLWLLNEDHYDKMKTHISEMEDIGVEFRIFGKEELRRMIPDLETDLGSEGEFMGLKSIDLGLMGVKCGTVDVDSLVRFYESEFLRLGGEVKYGTAAERLILKPEVEFSIPGEPFVWQDIRVAGVETCKGEILAETTVVSTGVWSGSLLDPIGVDSMMRPKKRVIFVFNDERLKGLLKVKGFNDHDAMPLTHIPSVKVYLKPDLAEGSIWMACADDFGRKFGLENDPQPEKELYANNIYHGLVKYLPCFENLRPVNMWAGQRAVNSLDMIPVVYATPGMIYVGATTGNGVLKCDALARIVEASHAGEEEAELYGGRHIRVKDIGVTERSVERERFKL